MVRVLLADDRPEVRSALRLLLEHELGCEVVAEAVDADSLLRLVEICRPNVVLLDWELGGDGSNVVAGLRRIDPDVGVVVMSGRDGVRRWAEQARADAFVSKGDPPEKLVETLKRWDVSN